MRYDVVIRRKSHRIRPTEGLDFRQTVGQIALGGLEKRFSPRKKGLCPEEVQRSFRLASWVATLGETYIEDQLIEEIQEFPAGGIGHCGEA
jgi:hypothetical protein